MADFEELMNKYCEQERIYRFEGEAGVANLAKIVEAIGYKDPNYNWTLRNGASVGSLVNFLEDCPGAIEAIHGWIVEFASPEWKEQLQELVAVDEEDGECEDDEDK